VDDEELEFEWYIVEGISEAEFGGDIDAQEEASGQKHTLFTNS
jgi:hypothetical protein